MQMRPPYLSRWRAVARAASNSTLALRVLPRSAGRFYARANLLALRLDDRWNFVSTLPPRELAVLVGLARGKKSVVELGTGTAWTSLVLALAEPGRVVTTYDIQPKAGREAYVALVDADTRARVRLLTGPGEQGEPPDVPVDLLYIDSNHSREIVRASFEHWEPHVGPGGHVAFDDYRNESYPGVHEAVADLGLAGRTAGRLFIWRKPEGSARR
jgi:predicted O-methyltransferase YrrM